MELDACLTDQGKCIVFLKAILKAYERGCSYPIKSFLGTQRAPTLFDVPYSFERNMFASWSPIETNSDDLNRRALHAYWSILN